MSGNFSNKSVDGQVDTEMKQESHIITVVLVPEKKGLFLKHSEYELTSKKFKCSVLRRYSDFLNLQNLLLIKFPYRMIPRLPPKQLMMDCFLEERRLGLYRWLRLVAGHPIVGAGELFKHFITDKSLDHQISLRVVFHKELDEFAQLSEEVQLPLEDQGRLAVSREIMRTMMNALSRMKRLIDQQAARAKNQSRDLSEMSGILKLVGSTGNIFDESTFSEMANNVQQISALSDKYAHLQQTAIGERFNVLLDVLIAHSDLCDRVEKGIQEEGKALSKMVTINKQKMKGVIRGTAAESVACLHEKELEQTNVVGALGRRSSFSLHCVLQETALAQNYLQSLPSMLLSLSNEESQGHSKIADIWKHIVNNEITKLN